MASLESASIIDMLRNRPVPETTPSLAEMRAGANAMMGSASPVGADITVEATTAGGVPCEYVSAPGADSSAVLIYLHGGGYVLGSPESHRALCGELSRASGVRVLSVDYRLAPENPCPAAVQDATFVYQSLIESGFGPGRITIGGDSAGGGLAAATILSLKERGLPMPAGIVMLSPWTDLSGKGPSLKDRAARDPMVAGQGIANMAQLYLNGADAMNPMASPLWGDLAGFPPALIHVGTEEVLYDDALSMKRRLEAEKASVTFKEWEGQVHVFQLWWSLVPEARQSIQEIGDFVKTRIATASA